MDEDNLLPLCRRHHSESHQIGWVRFIGRYPQVGFELDRRGWRVSMVGAGHAATLKLVKEGD